MSSTSDKIKGNWNVIKGKVKSKYGELTEDDLTYIEGKEEELKRLTPPARTNRIDAPQDLNPSWPS